MSDVRPSRSIPFHPVKPIGVHRWSTRRRWLYFRNVPTYGHNVYKNDLGSPRNATGISIKLPPFSHPRPLPTIKQSLFRPSNALGERHARHIIRTAAIPRTGCGGNGGTAEAYGIYLKYSKVADTPPFGLLFDMRGAHA